MATTTGQTVSHYTILEELGRGGMGIVYKAEDTRLKRTVALKFLPRGLETHEPERARFLQEAQAAAALNHPHICTIHDIQEEGDQQFIVMEYVDGITLRTKISRAGAEASRLPMADVTSYALQIGEALEEAHSRGIVHRDIKTENIMVTSQNQIKVMDFGLAKLKGSLKLTKTTSTLGTLAYMAPEHIEGRETDTRSDIFSFGVVLYELLTGHLPFRGEHDAAMMYAIVNEDPDPIQKYIPDIPSELAHILSRALEKDPEDRYQNIHDMVIDLRRVRRESGRVARPTSPIARPEETQQPPEPPTHRRRRSALLRIGLPAVVGLAAVAVIAVVLLRPSSPTLNPNMKSRVVQVPFRNVTYGSVSEDGNWLVFPAADEANSFDVYMMSLSGGVPRRITHDSSYYIFGASLSPDASTVVYNRYPRSAPQSEVVLVPTMGGTGRVIIEAGVGAYASYWLPGGQRIGYTVNRSAHGGRITHQCWTCRPDGSDRRMALADTVIARPGLRQAFEFSPDLKFVAWTKNFPEGHAEIMIRNLADGTDRQLTHDRKWVDDPLWTPRGDIIFSSNRGGNLNLWMIPISGGDPLQLTRGSGPDVPMYLSADGKKLVYTELVETGHIKLANLITGAVRQLTVSDQFRDNAAISPDGRSIAFPSREIDAVSNITDIYLIDRDGGNLRKITSDSLSKEFPAWSPDGRWIAYAGRQIWDPPDSSRVFVVHAEKPERPRAVSTGFYLRWLSENDFVIAALSGSYRGSLDQPQLTKIAGDSIFAVPVVKERFVAWFDNHRGRRGWYLSPASDFTLEGGKEKKLLRSGSVFAWLLKGGEEMYYTAPMSQELRRILLPSGKESVVRGGLSGLQIYFSMRSDGTEIAYTEEMRKQKFVVIEEPFR
ncbi:MAG: protein kinase [Bacteroidota bacterium]